MVCSHERWLFSFVHLFPRANLANLCKFEFVFCFKFAKIQTTFFEQYSCNVPRNCLENVEKNLSKGPSQYVSIAWYSNIYIASNLAGCSIYYSRTFGILFWNDIKWSAHDVLEQCLVYYICVQPCMHYILYSLVIRMINRVMIRCYLYI